MSESLGLKNSLLRSTISKTIAPDTLPLIKLVPFSAHPFKSYEGQRLADMVASIDANGVIVPIIVRPAPSDDSLYEILSGHNRVSASRILERDTIPAIIRRDLTDDEAKIIVTESNLLQRSFKDMLPSERAVALAVRHEAIKCQGRRADMVHEIESLLNTDNDGDNETTGTEFQKSDSREQIGAQYDLTGRTIADYLRIDKLAQPLKPLLDENRFGVKAGVQLSYITEPEMFVVADVLNNSEYKIDTDKARFLRKMSGKKPLEKAIVTEILSGTRKPKPDRKATTTTIKLEHGLMEKYFEPTMKQKQINAIITEALELWWNTKQ